MMDRDSRVNERGTSNKEHGMRFRLKSSIQLNDHDFYAICRFVACQMFRWRLTPTLHPSSIVHNS